MIEKAAVGDSQLAADPNPGKGTLAMQIDYTAHLV